MAPRKTTRKKTVANTVVVLTTSIGTNLFVRGNPTDAEVRRYVKEQTKRYLAGTPTGPSGDPAYRIFEASRFSSEDEFYAGAEAVETVNIADLLPTP